MFPTGCTGMGCILHHGECWHSLLCINQTLCMCSTAAPGAIWLGKHIGSLELMTACCSTVQIQAAHQGGY